MVSSYNDWLNSNCHRAAAAAAVCVQSAQPMRTLPHIHASFWLHFDIKASGVGLYAGHAIQPESSFNITVTLTVYDTYTVSVAVTLNDDSGCMAWPACKPTPEALLSKCSQKLSSAYTWVATVYMVMFSALTTQSSRAAVAAATCLYGCLCVCRIDVLCPNDWVNHHVTFTRF